MHVFIRAWNFPFIFTIALINIHYKRIHWIQKTFTAGIDRKVVEILSLKYFVFIDSWYGDVVMDDLSNQEWSRDGVVTIYTFIDMVINIILK